MGLFVTDNLPACLRDWDSLLLEYCNTCFNLKQELLKIADIHDN